MMKKLVSLLVIFAFVMTALAGCGGGTTTTTENTGSTQASGSTGAAAPDNKQVLEVQLGWEALTTINEDDLGKFIQDKLKIKIKAVAANGEKLKLMATSDTLPDVFGLSVGEPLFNQFKNEGFIREIPEDVLAKYPKLNKMTLDNNVIQAYKQISGKIYSVPRQQCADYLTKANQGGFYYRKDWATKLGVKEPTTMDEFYEMLKAFAQKDPDGNGNNDTYGTSGGMWAMHYIPWVNIYGWVKEDGKWIPGYVSKNVVDALKWWNRVFKEKVIAPDFTLAKPRDEFIQDKIGVYQGNMDSYWLWKNMLVLWGGAHKEAKALEAIGQVPPLKKDANSQPTWIARIEGDGSVFSSKSKPEVFERILELYEFLLSEEGRQVVQYGFKDKDWIIGPDGSAVSMLPNNPTEFGKRKMIWEVYPSTSIQQLVTWKAESSVPNKSPNFPAEIYKLETDLRTLWDPAVVGGSTQDVAIGLLTTPAKDKYNVSIFDVESELTRIIGTDDVEKEFNALVEKYMNVNDLKTVIEEVNKEIAAKGLDK